MKCVTLLIYVKRDLLAFLKQGLELNMHIALHISNRAGYILNTDSVRPHIMIYNIPIGPHILIDTIPSGLLAIPFG